MKVVNEFLMQKDVDYILNNIKNVENWDEAGGKFWSNKTLSLSTILGKYQNILLVNKILDIKNNIKKQIIEKYKLDKNIYIDTIQIARWYPNTSLPAHTDNEVGEGGNESFQHRDFAALIYLNDNFSGGNTFYPELNIEIKPKVGSLVIHPCDMLHGISEIEDNTRYTINSFWTLNKNSEDKWIKNYELHNL